MEARRAAYDPGMLGSPVHARPPVPDKDRALDDQELRAARALAAAGYRLPAQAVVAAAGTGWERRGHRIAILGDAAATHVWSYCFGSQAGGFLANWRWANSIG
jgi:hypothetical protein